MKKRTCSTFTFQGTMAIFRNKILRYPVWDTRSVHRHVNQKYRKQDHRCEQRNWVWSVKRTFTRWWAVLYGSLRFYAEMFKCIFNINLHDVSQPKATNTISVLILSIILHVYLYRHWYCINNILLSRLPALLPNITFLTRIGVFSASIKPRLLFPYADYSSRLFFKLSSCVLNVNPLWPSIY